jgi:hypothetical protein
MVATKSCIRILESLGSQSALEGNFESALDVAEFLDQLPLGSGFGPLWRNVRIAGDSGSEIWLLPGFGKT